MNTSMFVHAYTCALCVYTRIHGFGAGFYRLYNLGFVFLLNVSSQAQLLTNFLLKWTIDQ